MHNTEIRQAAKKAGVRLWQVSEELGISEFTFSRRMRKELPAVEKDKVMEIIERLSKKAD